MAPIYTGGHRMNDKPLEIDKDRMGAFITILWIDRAIDVLRGRSNE